MAYTTKTLLDGKRHLIIALFGEATDATGENAEIKVDRSAILGPDGVNPPTYLAIEEVWGTVGGFEAVHLEWTEAGGIEPIAFLSGDSYHDWSDAPLHPSSAPGVVGDGDIIVSTYDGTGGVGVAVAGDTYYIKLKIRKK